MPGFERFVADILTRLGIDWAYEPLLIPIKWYVRLPDPNMRRRPRQRRLICSDFFLPSYNLVIEIYSGHNRRSARRKLRHLQRISRQHGLSFLLLTPVEHEQLQANPALLRTWITKLPL